MPGDVGKGFSSDAVHGYCDVIAQGRERSRQVDDNHLEEGFVFTAAEGGLVRHHNL
jgi:hypothetical protein